MGPDEQSMTLGNDLDDITPWTGQYEWMFRMFSYGEILMAMTVTSLIATSSGTIILEFAVITTDYADFTDLKRGF